MLSLEKEFIDLEELKSQPDKVKEMVNKSKMIINAAPGSIVNTGNNNEIKYNNSVKKSDKMLLIKHLSDSGIPEAEIEELLNIVDEGFDKTTNWIERMVDKAKSGAWNIKVGAAGALLADAIKAYLGLP